MSQKKLTPNEVRAWLSEVESDLRQVDGRLEPLLAEQRQLEERRLLLQSLLGSLEGTSSNGDAPAKLARTTGSVRRYVVDRAAEILREEGRPMHINDLHARFVERGFTVPGAGEPVNLIVHLRGTEQIASPKRGIYGLTEQVETMPEAPRTRRRKTVRRSRARARNS
jgi:hypothetical protein